MAFVKLHGTILDSSIWSESSATRIVWITMLAMADQNGVVQASATGLARRAVVSGGEVRKALATFLGPDPESRDGTTGERVSVVPGGWLVLNHAQYRDRRTEAQIATAERVRRHRAKKRLSDDTRNEVTLRNDLSPSEAEAEADTEAEKKKARKRADLNPSEVLSEFPSLECPEMLASVESYLQGRAERRQRPQTARGLKMALRGLQALDRAAARSVVEQATAGGWLGWPADAARNGPTANGLKPFQFETAFDANMRDLQRLAQKPGEPSWPNETKSLPSSRA